MTVSFTCTNVDAVLNQPCPAPVTVSATTPSHTLKTLTDTLGVAYPVTVPAIRVDAVKPAVRIAGVTKHATYLGAGPKPSCKATDAPSGVASCRLKITRTPTSVRITATATDHAGNVNTATLTYKTVPFYLVGAGYKQGSFTVTSGHRYTVVALTETRTKPRLLAPTRVGTKFTGAGTPFKADGGVDGLHRFKLKVRITVRSGAWKLGVKIAKAVHVIKVRR